MAFVRKNRKDAGPSAPVVSPTPQSDVVQNRVGAVLTTNEGPPPPPEGSANAVVPKKMNDGPVTIRLGEQLIGSRLITQEQLDAALVDQAASGGRLGEVLVRMGVLTEQALAHALAAFFGFDVANLRRDNVDSATLTLVPENVAREYMAVPIRMNGTALEVAVAQPSEELRAALSQLVGRTVQLLIAPLSDIRWEIDSNYRAIGTVSQLVQAFESVEGSRRRATETPTVETPIGDDAPVVQVVDRILTQ